MCVKTMKIPDWLAKTWRDMNYQTWHENSGTCLQSVWQRPEMTYKQSLKDLILTRTQSVVSHTHHIAHLEYVLDICTIFTNCQSETRAYGPSTSSIWFCLIFTVNNLIILQ